MYFNTTMYSSQFYVPLNIVASVRSILCFSLPGFISALSDTGVEFTLVTLKEGVSSAVGAAALGAKAAGLSFTMDHTANVNVLFHYKPT